MSQVMILIQFYIDQYREFLDCETIEFDFNLGHRDQHMLSLCTRLDKQEKSYLREQLYNLLEFSMYPYHKICIKLYPMCENILFEKSCRY